MKVRNFFAGQYRKCWNFLCESRWFVVFALGIFALIFLVGFVFPVFFREEIFNFIAELGEMIKGKNSVELIWFIFFNNLKASFLAIVLGVGAGIFSLVIGIANGYLVGFVSRFAVESEGVSVLWQLVPHGIFELPAILFSIGIGLKLGVSVLGVWGYGKSLKRDLVEGLRFFVFVILPLLLVAGVIEGLLISL